MSDHAAETPEIIAHRGYSSRAPENTLGAIEAALDAGARSVEFDLQVASCGTPVLFHDVNLGRTTNGVGPVRRRTFGQLQALDAGKWFSADFEGEKLPSLAQALDCVRGRVDRIYPEVKGYRELEDLDRMARIVIDGDMLPKTTFIGMDWTTLDRIGRQDDAIFVGYIVTEPEQLPEALERCRARPGSIIDFDHRLVLDNPGLAERARSQGTDVAVWTVNTPEEASALRAAGVTRFTTNEVEVLMDWSRSSA